MKVDYLKTGNTLCAGHDFKDHGEISCQLLTCFTSLFDLNISHVLNFEMMNMMLESSDDDVTHLSLY